MVEPERVLHSVMVIAFERKGTIDENLKIIKAIQSELKLNDDEKYDALEHIKKFRGNGDWSGKRDAVVSVAIDRIEEAIENQQISNPSIINALKKLIDVTLNQQRPSIDSLAAFEEKEEEDTLEVVEMEDDEEFENETLVSQEGFSLGSSENEIENIDDEDIDPFDLIGGRGNSNSKNEGNTYKDPLDELMDEVDDEELKIETIELGTNNLEEKEPVKESSENQIIEMYRMMLDTVWVDDIIDPSEVALLARKRKDLDISFETHMNLVREMLEDSD